MQLISLSFEQWKQVWENLKFSTFTLKNYLFSSYSFPNDRHEAELQACGRGECIHQPNCQNVLRANSGDRISLIKLI